MTIEEARKLKPGDPIWVKVKAEWDGGLDYIGFMYPWEVARLCRFRKSVRKRNETTSDYPDLFSEEDCYFYHFNAKPADPGFCWVRAHVSWYNLNQLNEKGELGENNVDKNHDNKIRVCAYMGENVHHAGEYVHPTRIMKRTDGTVWSSELEGRHA